MIDQKQGQVIPEIKHDWEMPQLYQPEIHQYPPGKDPFGPRKPGPNIRWKIVAGTVVATYVVVKSQILQPPVRDSR